MVFSIFLRVAISCGVVLVYSFVRKYFSSCLPLRRHPETQKPEEVMEEEDEEEEEGVKVEFEPSEPSLDAIHLLRLSHAFCPPGAEPPIFGYDPPLSDYNSSIYSYELGRDDNFSDPLEESSFSLRDSFQHGHTHRISIKAPTLIHQPSTAEVSPVVQKSDSHERRSSSTFAPETHRENGNLHHRLFSLIPKGSSSNSTQQSGARKNIFGYYPKSSCRESNGAWGQLTSKRNKLFTVRPSISALRRLNQSKQVHQVEKPKLFTNSARIDYMSTVRTRFKLIHSKKLTNNPMSKIMPHNHQQMRTSDFKNAVTSSFLFGSV